ncbi:hypothetical protein CVIRNUC_001856 [Coccomyxa viridis]|uniref:Uncharacterized protein n=1 Tax=Coccomyxa viridis TaxID=1274662 RepID=A0AAV1HXS0_9CHLO|nr:hypothetical protein CVIRNUC_001856 [Coccomyxa viridis]
MSSHIARRLASSLTYGARVNYFPHLSTQKQPVSVSQNRESGHQVQGRDRSAHHAFRSSMSDPVYYVRSSMSDPSYPGPQRGMVTPQVNVAEGATHISTADFPMPNRHSMSEPAYFDEVDPKMGRRIN